MQIPGELATVVMGTGIVALALSRYGQSALSWMGLALTAVAWVLLATSTGFRLLRDRRAISGRLPSVAALANVAATAVLGALLVTHALRVEAIVLLAVAALLAAYLCPAVLRAGRLPADGSVFLLTVSVQSVAALAAAAAARWRVEWLAWAGLGAWAAGLALYLLALARFDFRQLRTGCGDQWVAGGALAISALAVSEITRAADRLSDLHSAASVLAHVSLVVWIAGMLWLVALVISELVAPRLRYHARRWSTVFPLGMYAAASFQLSIVDGSHPLHTFATVWTWVAVAVWAIVFAGLLRRARDPA